ncbi:hypothetical protein, partial [Streptomyces virginiae]|uniref:hypothetical protein n=1 Tax=Streptomyces virginiae TaxID=1961 RepID=UPI00342CB0B5
MVPDPRHGPRLSRSGRPEAPPVSRRPARRRSRIRLVQSDTDRTGFDTGAFASAGLFVAGNA